MYQATRNALKQGDKQMPPSYSDGTNAGYAVTAASNPARGVTNINLQNGDCYLSTSRNSRATTTEAKNSWNRSWSFELVCLFI